MDKIVNEIEALKVKVISLEMSIPKILEIQTEKLMSLFDEQTKLICDLQVKCANLEAIQMNLIASIGVASPDIFATIRAHAEEGLSKLSENDRESDYGQLLLLITGLSKPRNTPLWLVPKRKAPDSNEQNQQ